MNEYEKELPNLVGLAREAGLRELEGLLSQYIKYNGFVFYRPVYSELPTDFSVDYITSITEEPKVFEIFAFDGEYEYWTVKVFAISWETIKKFIRQGDFINLSEIKPRIENEAAHYLRVAAKIKQQHDMEYIPPILWTDII